MFPLQPKNGKLEKLNLAGWFFLKTGTFGAKKVWHISVDTIVCFVLEIFFRKEKEKYTVTEVL